MGAVDRATRAWRRALEVPYASTARSAQRLRDAHPSASPAELVELANTRFRRRVTRESAAVGALAAWPGVGTAVSAGASGAQLLAYVSEAAHHSLVVAHLYGLDMRDPAKRTALVLAALTGQDGAEAISLQVGIQAVSWFRSSFLNIRSISAEHFNALMLKWVRRRAAKSAAASTIGRLVPFGIGAAVGWGVGSALAKTTIEGLALALGPAPEAFAAPRVVEVQVDGDPLASRAFETLALPEPEGPGPRIVDARAEEAI